MWKPDYKAMTYLFIGVILGCSFDNLAHTVMERIIG